MLHRARWLALGGEFFYFECLGSGGTDAPPEWIISRRGKPIGWMPWSRTESFGQFERRAMRRLTELLSPRLGANLC